MIDLFRLYRSLRHDLLKPTNLLLSEQIGAIVNNSIISKSKNNQKHHTHLRIPISIDDAKLVTVTEIPENNKDILNDRGLKRTIMRKRGYDYSLEFRTDGVQVKFSWEKIIEKKSTNKKK
jgi:hypothetical protein